MGPWEIINWNWFNTVYAPRSTTSQDTSRGGEMLAGIYHCFEQKLSLARKIFVSKDTWPDETTLRTRAIAGYPADDVSPGIFGRLTNTFPLTNEDAVEIDTQVWSSIEVNPPSIQYEVTLLFLTLSTTSVVETRLGQNWVGAELGETDGDVGEALGKSVGRTVGSALGNKDGEDDGNKEGSGDGNALGRDEGEELGKLLGKEVGSTDGKLVGKAVGRTVGCSDGNTLGRRLGTAVGKGDGAVVGNTDGNPVGTDVGIEVCAAYRALQITQEGTALWEPTISANTVSPVVWSVSSSTHWSSWVMIAELVVVLSNTRKPVESVKLVALPITPNTPGGNEYEYWYDILTLMFVTEENTLPSNVKPSTQLTFMPRV
jgi:hypothetical protein